MKTTTDSKVYAFVLLKTFCMIALAGGALLWVWTGMPGPGILVAAVSFILGVFMFFVMVKRPPVALDFSDAELLLRESNGMEYNIYDIPASDFVCTQSKSQQHKDIGNIRIKNTRFYLYGVQNFSQVRTYIEKNFPQS